MDELNDLHPIIGRDGYFITKNGDVWSNKSGNLKMMAQMKAGPGRKYRYVSLGKQFRTGVHQLMAATFFGIPKDISYPVVRHKNDNPTDNRLENLEWGTQAENLADRKRNGTLTIGERNGTSKLTEGQVEEIKEMRKSGKTCKTVGEMFGISPQQVNKIQLGQRWKHLKGVNDVSSVETT